jgi:hypothetical protein
VDLHWLDWLAVAALGGVIGASEIVSRYRDAPGAALRTLPSIFYIAINVAASLGALGLMHAFHWFEQSRWTQVLMAGISAMAFFRTSLFVVRAGDRDVGVGPSGFLQIFFRLRTGRWIACEHRPGVRTAGEAPMDRAERKKLEWLLR